MGFWTWLDHVGGMETPSDLKVGRFRELFALLDLDIVIVLSTFSMCHNRLGVVPIACFAAQGGMEIRRLYFPGGGMPRDDFMLNHPRGCLTLDLV